MRAAADALMFLATFLVAAVGILLGDIAWAVLELPMGGL